MILVTGGTGFLGAHLLELLVNEGYQVRCLYRKRILQNVSLNTASKIDWVETDILDVKGLQQAFEGIDQVYHCAGLVSFDPKDKALLYKINAEGTANIVNAALEANVRKLVHVSSVSSIGRAKKGQHITEDLKWEDSPNNSVYAFSKYLAEMEVWRGIGEGLKAVIVNPSIIIGPGSWEESSSSLVNTVYKEFPYYTNGVNGFVYVRDVARAMLSLMNSDITAERFIINGDNWTYHKLFSTMAHYLGKKPPKHEATPLMGNIIWRLQRAKSLLINNYHPDVTKETARTAQLKVYYESDKLKSYLSNFTFTPLEKAIEITCKAYLEYIGQQAEKNNQTMLETA